jgi:hypothetical protein
MSGVVRNDRAITPSPRHVNRDGSISLGRKTIDRIWL